VSEGGSREVAGRNESWCAVLARAELNKILERKMLIPLIFAS